jgi:predicted polyphosphate/ATP-dependent NAD kinase
MQPYFPERSSSKKRLGLIVNPVAGLGGRVGLKGSDGAEIQRKARLLGAVPEVEERVLRALEALLPMKGDLDLLTCPGEMGERAARRCGFEPFVTGSITPGATTAADTHRAAQSMADAQVDLLLFAGGDGTARDIYAAIGAVLPALGIPAGVKIHSAVFAINPRSAGELALEYLKSRAPRFREAEVVDLDEDAYRVGDGSTCLYGYLRVPFRRNLVQNQKVPTPGSEAVQAQAVAADVVESMQKGWLYILGPGTTIRAIAQLLGMPKTLVGVDAVSCEEMIALDASEHQLLELLEHWPAKIVVTPIGGQGFLLGRGNQQISPRVIHKVGKGNILVVSLVQKLNALRGRPLLVDTGDPVLDKTLTGYISVTTGYHEKVIYQVRS